MIDKIKKFFKDRGASGVEYSLLAALVAALIVASVTILGDKTVVLFEMIRSVYPGE